MDCVLKSYLLLAFGVFVSLLLVLLSFILYKFIKVVNNKPPSQLIGNSSRFNVESSRVV